MAAVAQVAEWDGGSCSAVHHGVLTELLDNGPGGAGSAVIISHHPPHPSSLSDGLHRVNDCQSNSPPPSSCSRRFLALVNKPVSGSLMCCFTQPTRYRAKAKHCLGQFDDLPSYGQENHRDVQ